MEDIGQLEFSLAGTFYVKTGLTSVSWIFFKLTIGKKWMQVSMYNKFLYLSKN